MTVFATIKWCDEDLRCALKNAGIKPSQKNIEKFKCNRGPRTLEDRSIEEGWIILNDLIGMIFNGN